MLAWVDLETTGLDPLNDHILEVGIVLTGDRLERMGKRSWLVKPPNSQWLTTMPPEAEAMHQKSNLITEVMERGMPRDVVEADVCEWIMGFLPGKNQVPMCGSTVGFDRNFLRRWMPNLESVFHYRSIDVSTVKEMVTRWCPEYTWPPQDSKRHRVLADLDNSIAEARHYYQHIFFPAAQEAAQHKEQMDRCDNTKRG